MTSEFGWRKDPFTGKGAGHTGIDLGMPKGTPIRAALTGTVYLVRYSTTGYGYHVMIDHGGGFVTLYAHCSKLLVSPPILTRTLCLEPMYALMPTMTGWMCTPVLTGKPGGWTAH